MSADGGTKYFYCNNCQEEIKGVRVKCVECADFDLCLQCFSFGAEIGKHKKNHKYQLIDNDSFHIFGSDWTGREEKLLLDGIEQYGLGNWQDVASHIGSRAPLEVEEHYNSKYTEGNIGKAIMVNTSNPHNNSIDHTCSPNGPLSPSLSATFTPVDLSLVAQQELGYMPLRDDFEREYDNEAETLVSGLTINNDVELETALKLGHVDMYRRRQVERERRKKIARDFGLISSFAATSSSPNSNNKQKSLGKKKSYKEEKDLKEKLKIFSQFLPAKEFDLFFENIQKEKQLRSKVKELMRYRRNGITKIDDCQEFELARHKRERQKENAKKMALSKRHSLTSQRIKEDKSKKDEFEEMKHMQGYNMLSETERKLCKSLRMKPGRYTTIKTLIIKDHLMRRQGIPVKTRYPTNLTKAHKKRIISFLSQSGWIST